MVTFPVQLAGHPIKTVEGMAGMPMEYVERFRSGNWSERVTAGIEIAAMVGMTAESAAKLKKNIKNEKLAMEAAQREAANNRKNGIPDGCFTAGTSVLTKEGLKTIENIQSGEYVLAEEVESGTREYKKVIRTTVRKTNKIIHLVIAKEEIETTGNHPFWLPEQGWVPAEKLQLYDEVELSDGTHALIENLWHEKTEEEIPVYNMEVEDFHTYYIAKTGVLVHNDGGCGHSGGKVRISSKSGSTSVGRMDLAGKKHPVSGVEFDSNGFPIFESKYSMQLKPEDYLKSRGTHFDRASKTLYNDIMKDSNLRSRFTDAEIAIFKEGGVPKTYTWHHHQDAGKMQLVNRKIHRQTGHIGGFSIWGPGN